LRVRQCLLLSLLPVLLAQTPAPDAAKTLIAHLAALKDTQNLEARFVCEKRLEALETPLISRGRLWIRKGDPREGQGAVRFSTEKPYVSELILARGKVLVRSQHESDWTQTNQSGRPGLAAIMAQLGGWSTGEPGKITEMYAIASSADPLPGMPPSSDTPRPPSAVDTFALTPTNKDLAKVVKRVAVAIDRSTHHLVFLEILTQQDDHTRYWFYDVKINVELPADIFSPSAAAPALPPATSPASDKP
jgi:outer membrane lipoprotein-sorting protein